MLVPKPIVGKILRGEATMVIRSMTTRRPMLGQRVYVKAHQRDDIACHVLVLNVADRPLGSLAFEDARACGYRTTAGAKAAWVQEHDLPWLSQQLEVDLPFPDEDEMAARFDQRWAPKHAWMITFELDTRERPRLLAHRNAKADYVEHPAQAMPREPEAVSADTQKQFSREGHQGFVARELHREQSRERLGLEERLRLAREEAQASGADVDRQEQAILRRIKAIENKARRRT